ncbi:MAG: ATP-binding protein [Phycisphaerae bacterium]|nr:ATP-binding protein [Phycisphaerae bacterium]
METRADLESPAQLLRLLEADRGPMSWSRRAELARGLANWSPAAFQLPQAERLLDLLADDPKPEVRQAIASLLGSIPRPQFERLRPKLGQDVNAFVRNAVQRAVAKRELERRASQRVQFGVDQFVEQLQGIEKRYGASAASHVSRLCERYTELLVGSMVHDLRSILTHLKTNAAALISEVRASPVRKPSRTATRVRDDIEFLERTVQDMGQFTESLSAEHRPERLADLVRTAHEVAHNSSAVDGVEITIAVPESIIVSVARHLIVTALTNIIKNAYEAFTAPMPPDGPHRIEIAAIASDGWVELEIRDNGMGFSQEEADALRLFTPGRRNKTKRNSTGYGLPNAARKIVAQGGTIRFDSQEGCGTAVMIRLPLAGTERSREEAHGIGRRG